MPRLSAPASVLAAAVILACVSSGSYAAGTLITSKQIKDGTIKVKDLNPKAVAALKGKAGPAGPAGPAGVAGAKGDRGVSAWEAVPSGQTVTGLTALAFQSGAVGDIGSATGTLSARAAATLQRGTNLFFAASTGLNAGSFAPTSPECTGTVAAPTAPPGMACVYITVQNVKLQFAAAGAYFSDRGFTVAAISSAAGNNAAAISWAYTAP